MAAATNSSVFHISNTRHTFYKRYPCYRGHSSFELPHLSFVSHRNVKLDFESKKLEWKRGRREEWERKRTKLSVKCTAEGIDGGMIVGEDGINNVISNIPERYKVVCLVACVMCLCNADRVVMSVAVVPLAAKHGWSSSFLGIVQSSFLWGYIFSSVIGGALVDRYGGKRVMACGVLLWSLATLLTPLAANHSTIALLAIRAFFGLAEGVALPSMSTLLSRWFPNNERATAFGISMAGFHIGNVIGLLITPIMLSSIGIYGPFILFSFLGLLWVMAWTHQVTDDPLESNFISRSELRLIQAGKILSTKKSNNKFPPLGLILSKLPSWAIIFANATNNWGYFVLLSWMPVYFKSVITFCLFLLLIIKNNLPTLHWSELNST